MLSFLACSGATVREPSADVLKQSKFKWFRNQVNEALARIDGRPPDRPILVSITIGSNDFEFGDISKTLDRLNTTDEEFYAWANTTAESVKNELSSSVKVLLERSNVAVIVTEYHNPFNTDSWLFVGRYCFYGGCYPRTEYVVLNLNSTFDAIQKTFTQSNRLQVAAVHGAFQGHQSPRLVCGGDAPDINDTLIQYPTDTESNAFPLVPDWLENLSNQQVWSGDCFHPRETGAQVYADAINKDALSLGR